MIQKRLEQEITNFRRAAEPGCKSAMRTIDACYEKTGCSRPANNPTVGQCNSVPGRPYATELFSFHLTKQSRPGDACYSENSSECRAAKAVAETERKNKERRDALDLEQRVREWESKFGDISKECQQRAKEREVFAACQKQYDAACNPDNLNSLDDCLTYQVKNNGPTEKDAHKLMQKEWQQRSKTGSSITNNILD